MERRSHEGGFRGLTENYRAVPIEATILQDSPRMADLVRAGNLYLTVRDAIALALENNLDVEVQRLTPRIAEADLLRARAGGVIRGVSTSVQEGPSGVGATRGSESNLTGSVSAGSATLGGQNAANFQQSGGGAVGVQGSVGSLSTGPAVPSFDPAIVGSLGWNRINRPQTTTFITGTDALTSTSVPGNLGLQQGFATGGSLFFGYDVNRVSANNRRQDINPSHTAGLALNFSQPLLQGFGFGVNRRFIRIAENNRNVAGYAFEQQLMTTAYTAARLYWDLVALNEDVSVRRRTLELAERLLAENVEQERVGVLARIELVRTRAEVAQARRDLTLSQTRVLQQETVLKDYLTRGTVDDAFLRTLRVVPSDTVREPAAQPVEPIQDLIQRARQSRPDIAQAQLQIENAGISLTGSRNALLPSLDLVVSGRTNALSGSVNALPPLTTGGATNVIREPNPDFIGGLGTGFSQLFLGRFPDYGAELRLTIPIRNRAARSDYARDQLIKRQSELRLRLLEKQMRVDVVNALTALEQARAAFEAAREARRFQEEALEAERTKYAVGVSTNYVVIQYQRDLANARFAEIAASTDYIQAKNALDRATGT
ncbi:MAG TPA: TolC family protein, partial [Bryobacteraceae bacterium]|nr:TolC family protein [Bryobacteraceae bacterium]